MKEELRTAVLLFGMFPPIVRAGYQQRRRKRSMFAVPAARSAAVTYYVTHLLRAGHGQGYLPPKVTRAGPAFPSLSPLADTSIVFADGLVIPFKI